MANAENVQLLHKLKVDQLEFGEMEKQSIKPRNYVPLKPALTFQTSVTRLHQGLTNDIKLLLSKRDQKIIALLEEKLLDVAIRKKIPWFDKDIDNDFMKQHFVSSIVQESLEAPSDEGIVIRLAEDDETKPTVTSVTEKQTVLNLRRGVDFQAYDIDREAIDDDEKVDSNSYVAAVVELPYISFARTKFGGVFFLKQLLVVPEPAVPSPCLIKQDVAEQPDDERAVESDGIDDEL